MIKRTLTCAVVCSAALLADSLTLRGGRTVDGTYLGGDARSVRLAIGDRVESFSVGDIQSIYFGDAGRNSSLAPAPPNDPEPQRESRREGRRGSGSGDVLRPAPDPQSTAALSPRQERREGPSRRTGAEIPAGTALVVRMIDDADSERDSMGKIYRASLDEAVTVDGNTVLPRGADVTLKLVDDQQSGKLAGKTILTLDLMSVTVSGRTIDVMTEEVTQESASRTGRTGKVVGGTAALGAIIGAIAGGGKGAAVGAVSGAAVGGAAQVITKGQRVRIPSETRLTFNTQQPIRL